MNGAWQKRRQTPRELTIYWAMTPSVESVALSSSFTDEGDLEIDIAVYSTSHYSDGTWDQLHYSAGTLSFAGCHGQPDLLNPWDHYDPWEEHLAIGASYVTRPVGTAVSSGRLREVEVESPLTLVAGHGNPTSVPLLGTTPGWPFDIAYPRQSREFDATRPFVFSDAERAFLVEQQLERVVVGWEGGDAIDPGSVVGDVVAGGRQPVWGADGILGLDETKIPGYGLVDPVPFESVYIPERAAEVVAGATGAAATATARYAMRSTNEGGASEGYGAIVQPRMLIASRGTTNDRYRTEEGVLHGGKLGAHAVYGDEERYRFTTFYHPYVCAFVRELRHEGLDGLFKRSLQLTPWLYERWTDTTTPPTPFSFSSTYAPKPVVSQPYPDEEVDFSLDGAYSSYNWELFFHAPLLIATR